jgi:hypothetical protein
MPGVQQSLSRSDVDNNLICHAIFDRSTEGFRGSASYLLKWSDRGGDVGAVDREDCVAHGHLAAEGGRPSVGNGIDDNPSSGRAPLVFLPTEDHADADRLASALALLHRHNLAQAPSARRGTPNPHHADSNLRCL